MAAVLLPDALWVLIETMRVAIERLSRRRF
jgi:hypothetical protein